MSKRSLSQADEDVDAYSPTKKRKKTDADEEEQHNNNTGNEETLVAKDEGFVVFTFTPYISRAQKIYNDIVLTMVENVMEVMRHALTGDANALRCGILCCDVGYQACLDALSACCQSMDNEEGLEIKIIARMEEFAEKRAYFHGLLLSLS
jgi:hypothetical protein